MREFEMLMRFLFLLLTSNATYKIYKNSATLDVRIVITKSCFDNRRFQFDSSFDSSSETFNCLEVGIPQEALKFDFLLITCYVSQRSN